MSSIFEFDVDEAFDGDRLDESCWLPHYRPHWSTWDLAAARCTLRAGQLHLLIEVEADQPPWCPNLDEALRVSSLQTALWAGEPGSTSRPHQFDPSAVLQSGAHYLQHYAPWTVASKLG